MVAKDSGSTGAASNVESDRKGKKKRGTIPIAAFIVASLTINKERKGKRTYRRRR